MVHKEIKPEMFKDLSFPQRKVDGISSFKYRVYSDWAHYTLVEASNALQAISASGIKEPVRVLRDSLHLQNVITVTNVALPAGATQDAPAVAAPATPAEPAAPAADTSMPDASASAMPAGAMPAGAELSPDDVNKLLNPSAS